MKIKILSDSTCDLSAELLERYDISLAHLTVVKGDEQFTDGIDITPEDIFAHVAAGGALCSTSAYSIGQYEDLFSKYAGEYDGVIHINISSAFSSCYQNACIAAENFPNVRVIDSLNLSTGQGHVVLYAARQAENATDLDTLAEDIRNFTSKVEASFLLDRLDYMANGGRCSMVTALGANLLNLKPCIEVKDGKMAVVKKYRGNYAKCLANYVRERLENREDLDHNAIFLTNTPVTEECYTAAEEALSQYGSFDKVYRSEAGCTVSCHCGPGTLGILFVRK